MATKRWTFACAFLLVAATTATARAQTPEDVRNLARAGHEKKLAGLTLIIGGSALVATGIGLTIAGFASDDPTRCHRSGGFYYYSYRTDSFDGGGGGVSCWNDSLVIAGGTTWLLGAVTLGIGIPVYFIGRRQLREAAILHRWLVPPPPAVPPPPPPR